MEETEEPVALVEILQQAPELEVLERLVELREREERLMPVV